MLALPVTPGGPARFLAGRITYQLGRIATYCLLGVAAGCVGKSIFLAGFQRWLSIALGLAVLGGWLISKRVVLSKPVIRLVARLKAAMSAHLQRRSFPSLALLGLLNGLLPCGLVYVALAGAMAQGGIGTGLGYMAVFGLGTMPMMLAMSLSRKLFPPALRMRLNGAIPFGICLLALLLILRGMSLGIPYLSPDWSAGGCCAP
jgi:sulfite exporter TauE/SafE